MTIGIYAGSFDPLTNGHMEIIEKAANIFDKVIVAIAFNENKQSFIPIETRLKLIKESISGLKNVEADSFLGLTADYAKKRNSNILIRGIRNSCDYEYENQMAQMNEKLNPNLKTIFFTSSPENSFVSSSVVKEVWKNGGNIENFVPKPVCKYLSQYEAQ